MNAPPLLSARQRAALIAWLLARDTPLTARQVARLTGLSPHGAYNLLDQISAVVPIVYEAGLWRSCLPDGPD